MIEISKQEWSDEAWDGLASALGEQLPDIKAEVIAGESELWRVNESGYCITRFENHNNYSALVLVAGQGVADGSAGYIETLKAFCNIAANAGADRVETSTHRKGIGRMVESIGFHEIERKYELIINGADNNG